MLLEYRLLELIKKKVLGRSGRGTLCRKLVHDLSALSLYSYEKSEIEVKQPRITAVSLSSLTHWQDQVLAATKEHLLLVGSHSGF